MLKRKVNKYFQFIKGSPSEIIIIDDFLPAALSPWRTFEFSELIKRYPKSYVLSDLRNFRKYSQGKTFEQALVHLSLDYPELASSIRPLKLFSNINARLVYVVFLKNCRKYFPFFERHKVPFAFTLYPGGGFLLNDKTIDAEIKKICQSKYFRGVIVNQEITREYLLEKKMCLSNKIHLVSGIPFDINGYDTEKKISPIEDVKEIVFAAHRYSTYGYDKGFDLFQLIAKYLVDMGHSVRFHVVGDFSQKDLMVKGLNSYFVFHGLLNESDFASVFENTQIIISPNRPFALQEGAFDGFPLGSSISAGFYGNIMCLTDYFEEGQKSGWIDMENFVKITLDPYESAKKISKLFENPVLLRKLQSNSLTKLYENYSYKNQITSRFEFFDSIIK